jgi:hypothetical protein
LERQGSAKFAGVFIIVVDDSGKLYYVHPKSREMFYANGSADAITLLDRFKTVLPDDEMKLVKTAVGFTKPKTSTVAVAKPVPELTRLLCSQHHKKLFQHKLTNQLTTSPINGTNEPTIRVGIFYSVSPQRVTSTSPYKIVDANGKELLNMPNGGMVSVDYDEYAKSYYYGAGDYVTTKSNSYIRLVPSSQTIPFEVVSYELRPAWNPKLNDNKYLGTLEVRYNSSKDRT